MGAFNQTSTASRHAIASRLMRFRLASVILLSLMLILFEPLSSTLAWMLAGFSLFFVSDTFCALLPNKKQFSFVASLAAIACLSKFYWLQLHGEMVWWLPALLVAAGVILLLLFLPLLDSLIFPATVMGGMLLQLAWASGEIWLSEQSSLPLGGFVACLILIASKLILAIHHYRTPLRYGEACFSGLYVFSLTLMASATMMA